MKLSDAINVFAGSSPVIALFYGDLLLWNSGERMLYTQIDSEAPIAHEFDGRVPIPTVSVDTDVIAEDPVGVPVELSVPIPTVSVDTLIEFEVIYDGNGADAASNIATGGTAATSSNLTNDGDAVFDGDTGTYWRPNWSTNAWVEYDLGAGNEKAVDGIRIYVGSTSFCPNNVIFQGYDAVGEVWDDLLSTQVKNASVGWQDFVVPNSTAYQKYRLFITDSHGSRIYLYEMEMMIGNAPASAYHESGATVTVLGHGGLARAGYTFANWNTASDGSGTSYSPGDTFNITDTTTLYAQWAAE